MRKKKNIFHFYLKHWKKTTKFFANEYRPQPIASAELLENIPPPYRNWLECTGNTEFVNSIPTGESDAFFSMNFATRFVSLYDRVVNHQMGICINGFE